MGDRRFDDAPRWYWGCESGIGTQPMGKKGERFVVACGQRELWSRVRSEIDAGERCAWMPFTEREETPTLADCLHVLIQAREIYGTDFNRVVLEMARVQAFATFLAKAPFDLCNYVSNPLTVEPLRREAYSRDVEAALRARLRSTLGLRDEDD